MPGRGRAVWTNDCRRPTVGGVATDPAPRTLDGMAVCARCGTSFDERRYLLVVPGASGVFDRYECADAAVARPSQQLVDDLLREIEHLRAKASGAEPGGEQRGG